MPTSPIAAPPADELPPPLSFLPSPSLPPMWIQTAPVSSLPPPPLPPPARHPPLLLPGLLSAPLPPQSVVSPAPALLCPLSSEPSEEELLLSRRTKQRRADAARRRREAAALDELRQLMTAAEAYTSSGSAGSGGGPVKESGGWEEEHKRQQQRVEVLESSSQSMRQLLQMVQALKQHCDEQQEMIDRLEADRQLDSRAEQQQRPSPSWPSEPSYAAQSSSAPAKRLRLLSSAVSRSLDASLGSGALHSASFLPVTLAAVLQQSRDDAGRSSRLGQSAADGVQADTELLGRDERPVAAVRLDVRLSVRSQQAAEARLVQLAHRYVCGAVASAPGQWRAEGAADDDVSRRLGHWRTRREGCSRQPLRTVAVVSTSDWLYMDATRASS